VAAGFSRPQVTITHLIEQDDQVAIRGESDGTNTGGFMGQPPTGKKMSRVSNLAWFTMEGGRIKVCCLVIDETTMNNQLGYAQQG
jgi:predicted ester cyclase